MEGSCVVLCNALVSRGAPAWVGGTLWISTETQNPSYTPTVPQGSTLRHILLAHTEDKFLTKDQNFSKVHMQEYVIKIYIYISQYIIAFLRISFMIFIHSSSNFSDFTHMNTCG